MKQLKLLVIVLLLIVLIIPSIALATWWNPFSWHIWNNTFQKQSPTIQQPVSNNHIAPTPTISNKQANSTTTNGIAGWKTYTNTTYNYSLNYPSDWYINTKSSDSNIAPTNGMPRPAIGPGHYDSGGNTSIFNYPESVINNASKLPNDFVDIGLAVFEIPVATSLDDALKVILLPGEMVQKENVEINGVPGVRVITYGPRDKTKLFSNNVWIKIGDKLFDIGYRYNNGANSNIQTQIDEIVSSFSISH